MRSFGAAVRRAERDAQRRQRYLQREQVRLGREISRMEKQAAKQALLDQARAEVEEYEERLASLNDVHRTCGDRWEWETVLNVPPPPQPLPTRASEAAAVDRLNTFTPCFWERLFRKADKIRDQLAAAVVAGQKKDEIANSGAQQAHALEYRQWEEQRDLAIHVLEGDVAAYREAVDGLNPFDDLAEIGAHVEYDFPDSRTVDVSIRVDGEDVVPGEIKSLLASGKLSTKKMPKARFYELYQDYVCGCALRVAREMFALLPLDKAIVTASTLVLDSQTGRQEEAPILSVLMPRDTLERLSFQALDPSDAMRNFTHQMGFKRSVGFAAVERISVSGSSE